MSAIRLGLPDNYNKLLSILVAVLAVTEFEIDQRSFWCKSECSESSRGQILGLILGHCSLGPIIPSRSRGSCPPSMPVLITR
jgi:hypothetical protein